MSIDAPLLTDHEIDERTARCGVLRRSWQVLAPCLSTDAVRRGLQSLEEVAAALVELAAHARSARVAGPSEDAAHTGEALSLRQALDELDRRLTRESDSMLEALDRVTPARRREAWLGIGTPPLDGADTLLDLILEDDEATSARLPIIEDLVLAIATEEHRGSRRIVRDPVTLTARLRTTCDRAAAAAAEEDLAASERVLVSAAQRCEQEPTESILRDVAEQRRLLGRALLAPRILRALIFFDAAACSRPAPAGSEVLPPSDVPDLDPSHSVCVTEPRAIGEVTAEVAPPVRTETVDDADAAVPNPEAIRWRLDERQVSPAPKPTRRRRDLRPVAAGIGIAALATVGLFLWFGAATNVRSLPRAQLDVVSTALDSGYRDQRGTGPLFIGSVAENWEFLRPEEREQNAWEIIDHLTETGVREILLYGAERRVAVHYASGLPVRIAH